MHLVLIHFNRPDLTGVLLEVTHVGEVAPGVALWALGALILAVPS